MRSIAFSVLLFSIFLVFESCIQNPVEKSEKTPVNVSLTDAEKKAAVLTPEIMWKFGRIGEMQLSHDGKEVLYTVTFYNIEENRGYTHIFKMSTEKPAPVALTSGPYNCYNVRWAPDAKKIFYISDKTETPQLLSMNADGSNKEVCDTLLNGLSSFEISPDGTKILFCKEVAVGKSAKDLYTDLPKVNVVIAEDLMYRHWNHWNDNLWSHIFVAGFNNGKIDNATDIMPDEAWDAPLSPYFDNTEMVWSSDSRKIAYTCKKLTGKEYALSTNSDIYEYDLAGKTTLNVSNGMNGYDKYPVYSPDLKYLAWLSMETPGYESDKDRIIIKNLATGEIKNMSANFDQPASSLLWDENGKFLYFISVINGTHQIYTLNIEDGSIRKVTEGIHDYTMIAKAENVLLGAKMSMSMATELFRINPDGSETQLSFVNKEIYDNITFGKVQERWITTTDNKKMLTWVIYPPDFDSTKSYPALLYCQGGPQSAVSQFFSFRWNFQIMAAGGYIVVAPNRRGVPGFGQDWNRQISGDYGGQNMKDYISAIDALAKEPYIDENRLGAVGASYGGFSVFWLAGHHEGRFKAFIAHCGMFNLESQYGATEEMFFANFDLGGPYWDKNNAIAQKSYSNSPHRFVDKWDTPILIISGGKDFRIPYTESMQAFNAAQLRGIPSKLLIFPEETHFVLKPQNAILWQREFRSWLDTYLKK
ncbi:MAG TPA: S9 family peptidase [Bacteroidales bacterium]|nr:S9 family peptidase [Bacteroidales bacterium]